MKKLIPAVAVLLLALPLSPYAETQAEPGKTRTIEAKRGSEISQKDLAAIADTASARDEKGNPAKLTDDTYTVGAYSSSTISVTPKGNTNASDLITLDLLKPKGAK